MMEKKLILAETICAHYNIEFSFVDALNKIGLIQIEIIEQNQFIHQEQIDVVFNLLEKERELQVELNALKNRLRLYESD